MYRQINNFSLRYLVKTSWCSETWDMYVNENLKNSPEVVMNSSRVSLCVTVRIQISRYVHERLLCLSSFVSVPELHHVSSLQTLPLGARAKFHWEAEEVRTWLSGQIRAALSLYQSRADSPSAPKYQAKVSEDTTHTQATDVRWEATSYSWWVNHSNKIMSAP